MALRSEKDYRPLHSWTGDLAVVEHLLAHDVPGGAYTPAKLMGADLVTRLPGSGLMQIA